MGLVCYSLQQNRDEIHGRFGRQGREDGLVNTQVTGKVADINSGGRHVVVPSW